MHRHDFYGRLRGVFYDKEFEEFRLLCPDCEARGSQYFWPITTDFWNPGNMQRCRACNLSKKRTYEKNRLATDPEYKERKRLQAQQYHAENKKWLNQKHYDYMKGYRAKKRLEKAEKEGAA